MPPWIGAINEFLKSEGWKGAVVTVPLRALVKAGSPFESSRSTDPICRRRVIFRSISFANVAYSVGLAILGKNSWLRLIRGYKYKKLSFALFTAFCGNQDNAIGFSPGTINYCRCILRDGDTFNIGGV